MANKNTHIIEVLTKGAKKSEKEIKGVSGALGGLAKKAGLAAAAYFGSQALLQGVKSSIDLFAKQELSEKKLRFAAGASTEELIKQAQALQRTTKFGDEAIIGQQAYVKSLGISTEQTKEIITASVDLAAAMGISLESAVMNTTKTFSGMQGELGEKLPAAFKLLTAEQLKAGEGITYIREQFKGTAEVEAQSLSGALEQMSNAVGDAGEALGETLAPMIIASANAIKFMAESFASLFSWQDKYKALALETLGIVGEQEAKLILLNQELKTNASVGSVVQAMLLTLNNQLDNTAFAMGENADSSTRWTEGMLEASIISGDLNTLIEDQVFWGTELGLKLQALMILYNTLPEGLTVATEAQVLYNDQQLKNLETSRKQLEMQENFIKLYPQEAKALGLVSNADKDAAKDKEKRMKTMQKLSSVSKAFASAEKTLAIKSALEDTYSSATAQFHKFSKAYPAPLGMILGVGASGVAIGMGLKNVESIKEAQYGADFITDGPQMMLVGEGSGPEHVQVTPLAGGDENIDGPQGGGMTINIQGSVIGTEEFTEDTLIPQIKEGLRLGNSI